MALKVEFGLAKIPSATSIYQVSFSDVSSYLRSISISRGKSNELSTYDAASVTVQLSNEGRLFDPSYPDSPYASAIAPTGVLRISRDGIYLFVGLISDWNFAYDQSGDAIAEIQATDAFWLLTNLTLNEFTPADNQSSSARMNVVLSRPEVSWDLADTDFSTGVAILGGDSSEYLVSQGTSVLEYLQTIEKSEPARLFVGKDGKIVFKSRIDDIFAINFTYERQNLSTNPSFENNTFGWVAVAGSITRVAGVMQVGSYVGQIAASSTIEQVFNAASNATYTVSFYLLGTGSNVTVNLFQSLNGTDWELARTTTVVAGATMQRVSLSFTTDSDYLNGKLQIVTDATASVKIDAVLIEPSATLEEYFDGSNIPSNATIDNITYTYSGEWNL